MDRLLDILHQAESSVQYEGFRLNDPESFLAHVFFMEDVGQEGEFQVGYYNPVKQRMTTFELHGSEWVMLPDLEVFSYPGAAILPLDPSLVKCDAAEMMSKAQEVQQDLYPGNMIIKKILILQHLSIGQVFNISFITRAFKVINLKFDSETGKLKKHHMDSLLSVTK